MTTENYQQLGKRAALFSFLLGTLIMLGFFITGEFKLAFVGLFYILIIGSINVLIFIAILIKTFKNPEHKKPLLLTCILMLLNIPVMLLYCWFAFYLLDTLRITFTNVTPKEISDIKIEGCESNFIKTLKPNQSKTVWINIPNDCFVNIKYTSNGQNKTENVIPYTTGGMGEKMKYDIGGSKNH
jgi:hypothetical protein